MKRLELTVAADADLFDILAYGTAVHGEAESDAYYLGLTQAFEFLCEHPEAGQVYGGTRRLVRHEGSGGIRLGKAATDDQLAHGF